MKINNERIYLKNKIKKYNFNKVISVLFGFLLVIVCIFIIYIAFHENTQKTIVREEEGFTYITCDQYQQIINNTTPLGIEKEYTWKIDHIEDGETTFAFYVVHHYVDVYIDDELLYRLSLNPQSSFGKTIGSHWIFVPLYEQDVGKTIKIIATPIYESVKERDIDFMIGSKLDIYLDRLQKDLPQILIGMFAMVVGCVFLSIALYHVIRKKSIDDIAELGLFSLLLGIWKLSDTRFSPLLFGNHAYLLSCLSIVTLMIIHIPILFMLKDQLSQKMNRLIHMMSLISIFSAFALIFLQLFNIKDLREMLFIIHIHLACSIILVMVATIKIWLNKNCSLKWKLEKSFFVFCAFGCIGDIFAFYIRGHSSGIIFTLLGFMIYVMMSGIMKIYSYHQQEIRFQEQEAELVRNRISIMISQIQPHFLYNALNTIYYLCDTNPQNAKKAINDFSEYLRVNVDSLKRTTPVPFPTELKHIQTYLSLEKMRFQDELNIVYDIATTDFFVPALSIQPLVENSVKHGFGETVVKMTITIKTIEKEDCYEIHVIDNGVGFKIQEQYLDENTHVGLENVKHRLWEMCRAILMIDSVAGKGTHVIVKIPKE